MAVRLLEPRARYGDPPAVTPPEVMQCPGLSGLAKLTYTALASFAWHSDECWPSQTALAERASLSARQIRRCLDELQEAGLIECSPQRGRSTVRYRLLPVREEAPSRVLKPQTAEYSTGQDVEDCESTVTGRGGLTVHVDTEGRTDSPVWVDCQSVSTNKEEKKRMTNARAREDIVIDSSIERVLAAFNMTASAVTARLISERLVRYEETYPGLDAVEQAEILRAESDAEGRKAGNWLARWDGWMRTAWQRQERIRQSPPPQSTPSQPERLPLPVEPVDCPEVPAWGKLVNHLYGQFQAKRGEAPAEHPRAWTIFGCRPLPADSTSAVLALETHEPPDVAAELAKDVKWWLAGACLGGMRVEVTSRWAS